MRQSVCLKSNTIHQLTFAHNASLILLSQSNITHKHDFPSQAEILHDKAVASDLCITKPLGNLLALNRKKKKYEGK